MVMLIKEAKIGSAIKTGEFKANLLQKIISVFSRDFANKIKVLESELKTISTIEMRVARCNEVFGADVALSNLQLVKKADAMDLVLLFPDGEKYTINENFIKKNNDGNQGFYYESIAHKIGNNSSISYIEILPSVKQSNIDNIKIKLQHGTVVGLPHLIKNHYGEEIPLPNSSTMVISSTANGVYQIDIMKDGKCQEQLKLINSNRGSFIILEHTNPSVFVDYSVLQDLPFNHHELQNAITAKIEDIEKFDAEFIEININELSCKIYKHPNIEDKFVLIPSFVEESSSTYFTIHKGASMEYHYGGVEFSINEYQQVCNLDRIGFKKKRNHDAKISQILPDVIIDSKYNELYVAKHIIGNVNPNLLYESEPKQIFKFILDSIESGKSPYDFNDRNIIITKNGGWNLIDGYIAIDEIDYTHADIFLKLIFQCRYFSSFPDELGDSIKNYYLEQSQKISSEPFNASRFIVDTKLYLEYAIKQLTQ